MEYVAAGWRAARGRLIGREVPNRGKACTRVQVIGVVPGPTEGVDGARILEVEPVVPRVTVKQIGVALRTAGVVDLVVACAAIDDVATRAAVEVVAATEAGEDVIPCVTEQVGPSRSAELIAPQRIAAGPPIKSRVVVCQRAGTITIGKELVVATIPIESVGVTTSRAVDDIGDDAAVKGVGSWRAGEAHPGRTAIRRRLGCEVVQREPVVAELPLDVGKLDDGLPAVRSATSVTIPLQHGGDVELVGCGRVARG